MATLTIPTVVVPKTYADVINARFSKSKSHYENLSQRISVILNNVILSTLLGNSITDFMLAYPTLKSWSQLPLCQALETTLDLIDIDTTLQRMIDFNHLCTILSNFDPVQVMPICVYQDKDHKGRYVCWDGQHTVLALYVIATQVLKLNPNTVKVPIVVYSSNQKSQMRTCFIQLNGPGKKQLDTIDIIHQKIYGVRTDGSTTLDWLRVNNKYKMLEKYKIFLTHSKFGDDTQPGAYSRMSEFINSHYDDEVTEWFAEYFYKMCQAGRPVEPKESFYMYEFFQLCKDSKVVVDHAFIAGVTASLNTAFGGSGFFDGVGLWNRAIGSYRDWFRINKPNPDGTILGISYPERPIFMTFLLKQIAKNYTGKLPRYQPFWDIPSGDLF